MRISEEVLEFLISRERSTAYREWQRGSQESINALLAENNKLKAELRTWEERSSRLHEQVKIELTKEGFSSTRAEQKRIVKGITEYMNHPNDRPSRTFTSVDLVQALCLGDFL